MDPLRTLETAWSASTGWTNGNGRYLAVPPDPHKPTKEEIAAECRDVSPPREAMPTIEDDKAANMRERVRRQIGDSWISANGIMRRLGVKERAVYLVVSNALRHLFLMGEVERKPFPVSTGSDAMHFMYRKRER